VIWGEGEEDRRDGADLEGRVDKLNRIDKLNRVLWVVLHLGKADG
jgi:hypothetical protein